MNGLHALEKRVTAERGEVDRRLDELATRVDALEAGLPARLDGLERDLRDLRELVNRAYNGHDHSLQCLETRADDHAKRVGRLELAADDAHPDNLAHIVARLRALELRQPA